VTGFGLDVLTKALAVAHLTPGQPIPLLGGILTLRLVRNPGAAFSLLMGYTYVLAFLAMAVLGYVIARLVPRLRHRGWSVALGLLVAGVSGNLLDRLVRPPGVLRGHVVDFLQLPHWPIFNVADICITGAAVLIPFLAMVRNVGLDGVRYAPEPAAKGRKADE
jgi:signal peptidase II